MQRENSRFYKQSYNYEAHCCKVSGRLFQASSLFEISKKFKEPVRTNKIPTPKTKNVAPIVPKIRIYRRLIALFYLFLRRQEYVPREEISINTNALNASAVAITPQGQQKLAKTQYRKNNFESFSNPILTSLSIEDLTIAQCH